MRLIALLSLAAFGATLGIAPALAQRPKPDPKPVPPAAVTQTTTTVVTPPPPPPEPQHAPISRIAKGFARTDADRVALAAKLGAQLPPKPEHFVVSPAQPVVSGRASVSAYNAWKFLPADNEIYFSHTGSKNDSLQLAITTPANARYMVDCDMYSGSSRLHFDIRTVNGAQSLMTQDLQIVDGRASFLTPVLKEAAEISFGFDRGVSTNVDGEWAFRGCEVTPVPPPN